MPIVKARDKKTKGEKKIKKQAKNSKSPKNFVNDGTGLRAQLWGRKAGGSVKFKASMHGLHRKL